MQVRTDLLVKGERTLGNYQLQIARRADSGWTVTIPPLHALVSNYRLILWPQTRRPYPPASIPSSYIISVNTVQLDHRTAVLIRLKTGHEVYIIVATSDGAPLAETIQRMLTPPIRGRVYRAQLPKIDIERMIHMIETL
ncbi:hypothetical protein BAC2_01191 [uncultured bacterium]|nr:hypothetical protein BAC2_01191 [uncultured bacterium]